MRLDNAREQERGRDRRGSPRFNNGNGEKGVSFWRLVVTFAIIAFVVTAATSYIMYWFFLQNGNPFNFKGESELGPMYSLPEFVVNLNDPNWPRYVRLKVILEAKDKRALKEIQERVPQIRDKVITTIRDKTVKDIENSQGLEKLRGELKSEISNILGEGKVMNLYFDGFVMQ